jgi:hypothetical protein
VFGLGFAGLLTKFDCVAVLNISVGAGQEPLSAHYDVCSIAQLLGMQVVSLRVRVTLGNALPDADGRDS